MYITQYCVSTMMQIVSLCKQARVCRTLKVFQTRACSLFTVINST